MTRRRAILFLLALGAALLPAGSAVSPAVSATEPAAGTPRFALYPREIDPHLGIGYAVSLADLNGDRRPDVVAVSERQVVWYENPGWGKHVIADDATPRDNVCIAPLMERRGARPLLALGARWRPSDTEKPGTIHLLTSGEDPAQPWRVITREGEPSVHRMRWGDVDGDGRRELIVAPLQGRGTRGPDWQGAGVRLIAYRIPTKPDQEPWTEEVIDSSLHVLHNLWVGRWEGGRTDQILTASAEGVSRFERRRDGTWRRIRLAGSEGAGRTAADRPPPPQGGGGASEIQVGRLAGGERFLATIEPWHGNQVAVFTHPTSGDGLWTRRLLDDTLRGGHALACVDLDADGRDEVIAGFREPAGPERRPGIRIYRVLDTRGERWEKTTLDDVMACEDLTAGDLDGDRRPDIVASGRATHNVKLYLSRPPAGPGTAGEGRTQ